MLVPIDSGVDITNPELVELNRGQNNNKRQLETVTKLFEKLQSKTIPNSVIKDVANKQNVFTNGSCFDIRKCVSECVQRNVFTTKGVSDSLARNGSCLDTTKNSISCKKDNGFDTADIISNCVRPLLFENDFDETESDFSEYVQQERQKELLQESKTSLDDFYQKLHFSMVKTNPEIAATVKYLNKEFQKTTLHTNQIMEYLDYIHDYKENNSKQQIQHKGRESIENSELFGIGQNDDGQLGLSNVEMIGYPCTGRFRKVDLSDSLCVVPRIQVVQVSCGSMMTCVLTSNAIVYSWGFDDVNGRKGEDCVPLPIHFSSNTSHNSKIIDIACTECATACIDSNGGIWTFGKFRDHQGISTMNTLEPKFLGNFDAVSITGGESHFSFISSTGLVYTWGCGEYGQLVRPFSPKRYQQNDVPTRVFVQAEQVFSCGFSTFIITSNQILAAGKNGFGELALGDTNSRYHPVPIPFFTGKKISKIVGGLHHVLFLQKDGVVWASGRNTDGQLGIGSTIETTKVPIKIPFPKGIRIVDVGAGVSSHHSYEHGDLWTCGQNIYEQCGYAEEISYSFRKVELKGRKCTLVGGGCQFTIVALTKKYESQV